jgi:hypothetical protein
LPEADKLIGKSRGIAYEELALILEINFSGIFGSLGITYGN